MNARKLALPAGLLLSLVSGWAATQQVDRQTDLGALVNTPLPDLPYVPALIATDTTPPTVTAPIQKFAKGRIGSTVPINVHWSASDESGIKSYKLWRSTNGGSLVLDTTLSPTATSHTYRLPVGNSYRFRVVAYDNAGNASAPARGPTFTPTVTDDRTCCFYFARGGDWTQELQSGAYGGSVTTLYAGGFSSGGWAVLTFTGRDVAYVAYVSSSGWVRVSVYIDDILVSSGSQWNLSAGPQTVFSKHWASSGTHKIKISGSGWGAVNVDGFVVNE